MTVQCFDATPCQLGEGPLWHPLRQQFFWFDILAHRLYTKEQGELGHWQFDEPVSAAAWIDTESLLIASASRLFRFNLSNAAQETIALLEADNPVTRSNDGRADPQGGFWIGTMGRNAEPKAGAIYRYHQGEVRCLFSKITIPNSICFSPDGEFAYFVDTAVGKIMRQRLDAHGWPTGDPRVFIDSSNESFDVDGSVVDASGNLWNARWRGSGVACYSPAGELLSISKCPASQTTCPAFGGEDYKTLLVTSARDDLSEAELESDPLAGQTFTMRTREEGAPEHCIKL